MYKIKKLTNGKVSQESEKLFRERFWRAGSTPTPCKCKGTVTSLVQNVVATCVEVSKSLLRGPRRFIGTMGKILYIYQSDGACRHSWEESFFRRMCQPSGMLDEKLDVAWR
jgi:hypothetical protein